jgi:hypothetical protein
MTRAGWLLAAVSVGVAVAVGVALRETGTPGDARIEKLDERRVEELRQIAQALEARRPYVAAVDEAEFRRVVALAPRGGADPVTGRAYGFRARADSAFELGARFDRDNRGDMPDDFHRGWAHGAGEWWYVFGQGGALLPDAGHPDSVLAAPTAGLR